MKNVLKLEEAMMFALSVYALYLFHAYWWYYLLLLFGPDISMIGYGVSNAVGAGLYNFFHHKGIAVLLFAIGHYTDAGLAQIAGIILFGHSSMDRMFGYGLKYERGFKYTHLGTIGRNEKSL